MRFMTHNQLISLIKYIMFASKVLRAAVPLCSRQLLWKRSLSLSSSLFNDIETLEQAKQRISQLTTDPGNDVKLKLYAFYKQATIGACNTSRPGMMDFVGRAKWDAWNALGQMTQSEAIANYSGLVDSLVGGATTPTSSTLSTPSSDDILVSEEGGVQTIVLNRPTKLNAITFQMYQDIEKILKSSATNPAIKVTLFTGTGDYYCSGNDLSNFLNIPPEGPEQFAADSSILLRNFVSSIIQYPKPLIAAVNGPAVGISVTILCLFDLVYAADNATFHTPFMTLGQSPEGCSSFLFPRIMGPAKSNEILILGRKISALEAYERNLVTRIFPKNDLQNHVKEIVSEIAQLPPQSVLKSKSLIRSTFGHMLEEANANECELLRERWLSEECVQAIIKFMERKK